MRQYVPLVLKNELDCLKKELEGQSQCPIFDGTTRVGEALAVVAHYCTEDFHIKHRLIALTTAAKYMSGAGLSGMLLRILVKRVEPESLDLVLASARDSCATNGAAVNYMKLNALQFLHDGLCFSHTLHNCAKHMQLSALEELFGLWFQLMAHTHRVKVL